MTELNDIQFTVANVTTNTFELSGIDSSAYGAYTSGGNVTEGWWDGGAQTSGIFVYDTIGSTDVTVGCTFTAGDDANVFAIAMN